MSYSTDNQICTKWDAKQAPQIKGKQGGRKQLKSIQTQSRALELVELWGLHQDTIAGEGKIDEDHR